jgi:hypothetical protein
MQAGSQILSPSNKNPLEVIVTQGHIEFFQGIRAMSVQHDRNGRGDPNTTHKCVYIWQGRVCINPVFIEINLK